MKKIEIFLKNILLRLLLISSKNQKKYPEKVLIGKNSKILFVRLNRIGDALVTTPLLYQIKKNTDCSIFVLADKKNHFVFENCPDVDEVIIYEKGTGKIRALNKFIKKHNIETIVDLHDDVSTTVSYIIWLAKTKYKFGLKKKNEKLYTNTVERLNPAKYHVIERILEFTRLFGFQPNYSNAIISYKIKDSSLKFAEKHIGNLKNKFLLGINITAGSDARYWGINNFKKLIEIISTYNINIVLFTTESKYSDAKQIVDEKFIYPISDDFDIFAAGISMVDMLFTPDTSVIHVASMFKIPVFGIYVQYNTDDEMIWSPYDTDFDCVITKEATFKNLNFEEVRKKFIPFLEKHLKK